MQARNQLSTGTAVFTALCKIVASSLAPLVCAKDCDLEIQTDLNFLPLNSSSSELEVISKP